MSGDGGVEKAASITSGGSSRGRKNFSRSGPGTRRYGGNEEISKSRNYFQNHRKNEENPEGANATVGFFICKVLFYASYIHLAVFVLFLNCNSFINKTIAPSP